jgi:polyferredoxin
MKSKLQVTRIIILSMFLIGITLLSSFHQVFGGGSAGFPSVDVLCPFGGLEALYKFLISHEFLKRTNISNFVLLGGSIALVIIVGRFFCGWICMLGFLQEIFGKIGRKLFGKRFIFPVKIDRYLRFLKYIVLCVVVFLTWKIGDMIIRPYDPFVAWAHIPSGFEVFEDFLAGFIFLAVSLILSMFVDRFFCKYLCPLGGFLGILHRVGLYKIKRDESTCINCKKCDDVCPVNLDISTSERVTSSECINCMQCISYCPTKKDTLKPVIFKKFVKAGIAAAIGMVIYFGIIGVSSAAGIWRVNEGEAGDTLRSGGNLDPANIRGYMKMAEIAENFNISVSDFYAKLGIIRNEYSYHLTMKEAVKKSKNTAKELKEEDIRNAVKDLLIGNNSDTKNVGNKSDDKKKLEKSTSGTALNPEDIKGTMSLKEISAVYKVDLDKLYLELKIQKSLVSSDMQTRDIKSVLSKNGRAFEVEEIRKAVKKLR